MNKSTMTRLLVLGLACIPLLLVLPLLARAHEPIPQAAALLVLQSDESGMVLELEVPQYDARPITVGGRTYLQITAPGLDGRVSTPGQPDLPAVSRLLALPPGAKVRVTLLAQESDRVALRHPVRAVPAGTPDAAPAVSQDNGVPFAGPVQMGKPVHFRDQRLASIEFFPFQYEAVSNQLEHTRRLLVRVDFVATDQLAAPAATAPALEGLLQDAVLNYQQGLAWRSYPADFQPRDPGLPAGIPVFRIEVDADGLYQVTYADLVAAGMEAGAVNPGLLALSSQGRPVAFEWMGDTDSIFEDGEGFRFYGEPFRGTVMDVKYTDVNVYWLSTQGPAGPRVVTVNAAPAGAPAVSSYRARVHMEQDLRWNPVHTIDLGEMDTWYWAYAVADVVPPYTPVTSTQTVALSSLAPDGVTATVRAELFADCKYYCTGEVHHGLAFFNGQLVDEQGEDGSWINIEARLFSGTISHTDLIAGSNQFAWVLRSDVVGPSSWKVYLNWFEVEYQRLFAAQSNELAFAGDAAGAWTYTVTGFTTGTVSIWDISTPLTPTRLLDPDVAGSGPYQVAFQASHPAGARFLAVAEDRVRGPLSLTRYLPPDLDPPAGADWVAITHADFITAAQRLADHRTMQGMRALVVDAADLYNQFSYGVFQPAAIRDYLAYALTWPGGGPGYVVLLGDGNWNFHQESPYYVAEANFIPPYLGFLDPYQGEVPADNQYVMLVGDDAMPDMALGRLPARTPAEAELLVDKILTHEALLGSNLPWQSDVVFVADNNDGDDFPGQSDQTAALLPSGYNAVKIYYGQSPYTTVATTTHAITSAFNAGATLFNYRGHGALQNWANENLFRNANIPSLTNLGRLPVVLTMDCLDTYFAYPGTQALAEELFRHSNGGSVGHWGSSGLGLPSDHSILHEGFYRALFHQGQTRLGQAVLAAKLDFVSAGWQQHNLHTFTILGDPAMPLIASYRVYLPLVVTE